METILDKGYELEETKDGRSKFHCLICGRRYKMLGPHLENHYKNHMDEINETEEKSETPPTLEKKSPWAGRLTPEKFSEIKELLFKGETRERVRQLANKSDMTVRFVNEAKDFADYWNVSRAYWQNRRPNYGESGKRMQNPTTSLPAPSQKYHYERLDRMRSGFETMLADFISQEMRQTKQDLIRENEQLKNEVKLLKQQLENAGSNGFVNKLQEKLQTEE